MAGAIRLRLMTKMRAEKVYKEALQKMPRKKIQPKGVKARKNGDGSVVPIKRKDGTWAWRARKVVDKRKVDGKEKYVVRQRLCDTEEEAEQALDDLQKEYDWEIKRIPAQKLTVEEVFELWIDVKRKHKRSDSLIHNYYWALSLIPDLKHRYIGDISAAEWQEAVYKISLGKNSLVNLRSMIYQLLAYARKYNYVDSNPFSDPSSHLDYFAPDEGYTATRDSLTLAEVHRIYDLAVKGDEDAQDIIMLCSLGWRPNEAMTLRVENVDLAANVIIGGFKTEAGRNRTVPMTAETREYVISRIHGRTEGWLWEPLGKGKKYSDRRKLRAWRDGHFYPTLERADIDNPMQKVGTREYHRITPHSCRHTFATLMKNVTASDVDKMAIIGHASERQLHEYQSKSDTDAQRIIAEGVYSQIKTDKNKGVAIPLSGDGLPAGISDKVVSSTVKKDKNGKVIEGTYELSPDARVADLGMEIKSFHAVKFLDLLERAEEREELIKAGVDDGAPKDKELYDILVEQEEKVRKSAEAENEE